MRYVKEESEVTQARKAGVLMHISSLPGEYGIGDMGKRARQFADFAKEAGFAFWQILPLVQTGLGDSPYQSVYSASGNPLLIDLENLVGRGLLKKSEIAECKVVNEGKVAYEQLRTKKMSLLRKAYSRFDKEQAEFKAFCTSEWMEYGIFMAIRERSGGKPFLQWEKGLRFHEEDAVRTFYEQNAEEVLFWLFIQYIFFQQWRALKSYINELGIKVIGDIPLYVAYDSVDVWANEHLFKLDKCGRLKKVAGVPPDYFSQTGQLWGNPVYDWKVHEESGYSWWIERMRRAFELYDVVRIDHFRGFDRYYEIDAKAETAIGGKWKKGPGAKLFEEAKARLGRLPVIAEDLGLLDEGVYRLMRKTGYPGMKVIQFAFDGNESNPYLPANIEKNSICYTGTHDNDTLIGFLENLAEWERESVLCTLKPLFAEQSIRVQMKDDRSIAKGIMDLALSCKAQVCIIPVQDLLLLGSEARMNVPGVASGNWVFRLKRGMPVSLAQKIRKKLQKYCRI